MSVCVCVCVLKVCECVTLPVGECVCVFVCVCVCAPQKCTNVVFRLGPDIPQALSSALAHIDKCNHTQLSINRVVHTHTTRNIWFRPPATNTPMYAALVTYPGNMQPTDQPQ